MDPIKKLKLRLYYIFGESLVFLSLVSTIVLNLALSNLTNYSTRVNIGKVSTVIDINA